MLDRRTLLRRLTTLAAASGIPGLLPAFAAGETATATGTAPKRDRLGELLPTRKLGRHDEHVTTLCLGGSHYGMMDERTAQAVTNALIEQGLRFIDTAEMYQGGRSEQRIGRLLTPSFRDELFIMTKTKGRTARQVARDLDGSRKRLGVDVIDLWQLHAIQNPSDVDVFFDRGGLDVFLKAREDGKARYLGFTGHNTPAAHERMLDRLDEAGVKFDVAQMPINLVDPGYLSFIDGVLPRLVDDGYAVLAMKTLAFGQFYGRNTGWANRAQGPLPRLIPERITLEDALHYVWAHPVASIVSGMETEAHVVENAKLARSFAGLDEERMTQLVDAVADAAGDSMEFYKAPGVG